MLFSVPDGRDGEGGERVPVQSGHHQAQAWLYSLSPSCPGAVSDFGAWQYPCCLPWRAWGESQPFGAAHRSPWLTAASFPDGAVYALGGMGVDTSPQALVRVYEPAKDHWQPLPSMPTPCYGASAFLQGNKIFVLGRCCWGKPSIPCVSTLPFLCSQARE